MTPRPNPPTTSANDRGRESDISRSTTRRGWADAYFARTGGLVATAALGFVLTSQATNLVGLAATAAWGGVGLALAAAFTGAIWVRNDVPDRSTLKS